jgi:23S rRNA (adenine2030-N6)-methyltransferase
MFILNPPYTLEATLRETMPYLVKVLGQDSGATFRIERGTQVTGTAVRPEAGERRGGPRQPVGNARRASPLSGGGSLRLPGQPFGEGPRARTEGAAGGPERGAGPERGREEGKRTAPRPAGERAARPQGQRPGTPRRGPKGS